MVERAVQLKPNHAHASNSLARQLFWMWERVLIDVTFTNAGTTVCCTRNPCALLLVGDDVRMTMNKDSPIARVKCISKTKGAWLVHLSRQLESPQSSSTSSNRKVLCVRRSHRIAELAARAFHNTSLPDARGEAYVILGRNYHADFNIVGALPYFVQACRLSPDSPLAHFCLAQVRATLGELSASTGAAETARALAPTATEVWLSCHACSSSTCRLRSLLLPSVSHAVLMILD
mmetsp:Transcript_29288/g.89636  ORF Transcript_29288/g.89636 Transcript_29288/m.89636 type:complete len:233 (-) Transcript_29288:1962-2660(-)